MLAEKNKSVVVFTIMVHRSMGSDRPNSPPAATDEEKAMREAEREGWVLTRQLNEFQQLHDSLRLVSMLIDWLSYKYCNFLCVKISVASDHGTFS